MTDEEKAAALRAYCERDGGMPFEKGDLITPRPDAGIRGAGSPFIVLEIDPYLDNTRFTDSQFSPGSGDLKRLRVATFMAVSGGPEAIATFVTDPAKFEPWPVAAAGAPGDDGGLAVPAKPLAPYLAAAVGDTVRVGTASDDWAGEEVRVTSVDDGDRGSRLLCRRLDDPLAEDERWITNKHVESVTSQGEPR
jgi:hypothetical protein